MITSLRLKLTYKRFVKTLLIVFATSFVAQLSQALLMYSESATDIATYLSSAITAATFAGLGGLAMALEKWLNYYKDTPQ